MSMAIPKRIVLIAICLLLVITLLLVRKQTANAAPMPPDCTFGPQFDRCANVSYYMGLPLDSNLVVNAWIWPWGNMQINSAEGPGDTGFVNVVQNDLFGPNAQAAYTYMTTNPGVCSLATEQLCKDYRGILIGTSYIVNTMMGFGGEDPAYGPIDTANPLANFPRTVVGVDQARALFNQWRTIVNYYDSQGWVNYNKVITFLDGEQRLDTIVYYNGLDAGSYVNSYQNIPGFEYIQFTNHDADGNIMYVTNPVTGLSEPSTYTINKYCGNITGLVQPLTQDHNEGFDLNPVANVVLDSPADAPGGVTFNTGINVSSMSGPQVNGIKVDRSYYKITGGTQTAISLPSAPASGDLVTVPNSGINYFGGAGGEHVSFGGALNPGDQVCADVTISPAAGKASAATNDVETISTPSRSSHTCIRVYGLPYLSIYGSDVFAGGGIGAIGCSPNATARINAMFDPLANKGSGTQFATFAMGVINGFSSARLRTTTPTPPDGLYFTNSDPAAHGNFGGATCNNNYTFDPPSTSTVIPPNGGNASVNLANMSGIYHHTGSLSIDTGSGNINNSTKLRIYVDGDLIIKKNITYVGINSWNSPEDIPSVMFIVRGNIYIDKSVTNLDGVYVAELQGGSKGTIYTCSEGGIAYTDAQQLPDNCNSQLIVHGNLLAESIKWLRTYGSISKDVAGENPFGGPAPHAAEIIISGPESYIASPPDTKADAVESFFSAPPVL